MMADEAGVDLEKVLLQMLDELDERQENGEYENF